MSDYREPMFQEVEVILSRLEKCGDWTLDSERQANTLAGAVVFAALFIANAVRAAGGLSND